jgi:hypothetical protein
MERAVIVRGRLRGPALVELEEPVAGAAGVVEVIVRQEADGSRAGATAEAELVEEDGLLVVKHDGAVPLELFDVRDMYEDRWSRLGGTK